MYKWMYDRMVTEYSKETKEELIQRIMASSELECEDRCFANQCMAGTSMYNVNNLFNTIELLKNCLTNPEHTEEELIECTNNLWVAADNAKESWNYIRSGIAKINDDSRTEEKLKDFKKRVMKETSESIDDCNYEYCL